ncbi:MAG: inositol monophosphatase family protein [Candidatus Palauibacterales bacterium]|nr:inositol monophosphatase family protein [Candidatus Palauibacterales bacterium]MDP2482845.1 inositol monophosphatase family protein [Candidatus Palauibacterales bacterium]
MSDHAPESKPSGGLDDGILLETARRAAARAATIQSEARGQMDPSRWTAKGRSDFVTEVDTESERAIVSTLLERFPDHRVLAEEGSENESDHAESPVRWIIDPLDGTTNWLHGYPEYAVSIAAEDEAGLRAAVVLNSATGELFEATRGGGARRDGHSIRASELARLDLALVGTGFPFKKLHVLPAYLETFSRVLRSTAGIRRAGAAALDLCDLACGRLDAFWEYWLMPWDVAAGALIVREAGGTFERMAVQGLETGEPGGAGDGPAGLGPGAFLGANGDLIDEFRLLVNGGLP